MPRGERDSASVAASVSERVDMFVLVFPVFSSAPLNDYVCVRDLFTSLSDSITFFPFLSDSVTVKGSASVKWLCLQE